MESAALFVGRLGSWLVWLWGTLTSSDVIACLSAVVALTSVWVAILQRRDALRLAKEQAADSKRSAEFAERSAKAAEQSALTAREGLQLGRPWVTVGECRVHSRNNAALPIATFVTLTNGGKTPAVDLRTWSECKIFTEKPEALPIPDILTGSSSAPLGPGLHATLQHLNEYSPLEVQAIIEGRSLILLYGACTYRDIFGHARKTTWCYSYHSDDQAFSTYSNFNTLD